MGEKGEDTDKGGRPRSYEPKFDEQAQKLCKLGATDADVADFFGVTTTTIYRWKHQHPTFCEALVLGKDPCDDRAERTLYQRAVGYEYPSEKVFQYEGEVIRAPIMVHVPGDVGALTLFLKNRRGDVWRDKATLEITGDLSDRLEAAFRRVQD